MKKNKAKIIHVLLIGALLGAGIFYFSRHEKSMLGWLPFYGWEAKTGGPDLPVSDQTANLTGQETSLAGIPVLLYHGILEKMDPSDGSNTSVATFESQLRMLKDEGYTSINTRELYGFISGKGHLPPKPVVISFDDGRIDSVKNGDPVLRKYGFQAVMFVAVGKQNHGDKFFLSWEDLSNMKKSGRWDIQLHAGNRYHTSITIDQSGQTGYFASNKEWLPEAGRLETDEEYGQRLIGDVAQGKRDLEEHLPGIDLAAFAFPYGDYGEDAINLDQETAIAKNHAAIDNLFPISFGFDGTYNDNFNFFYFKGQDPHLIQRLDVRDALSAQQLKHMLDIYANKSIPYSIDKFDQEALKNMLPVWSKPALQGNDLSLRAASDSTGALTVLTGSNYWQDYELAADVSVKTGQTGSLLGRYVDVDNYLLCGVDGEEIAFRQMVGGEDKLIAWALLPDNHGSDFHLSLDVRGMVASCEVNGQSVGRWRIDQALALGAVGFECWDRQEGKAAMAVHDLRVARNRPLVFGYAHDLPVNGLDKLITSDTKYLDVISPAWYELDGKGNVLASSWNTSRTILTVEKGTSVFPLLSDRAYGGSPTIQAILADDGATERAVESIVQLALEGRYSGMNLDIENLPRGYKDRYAAFVKRLAAKMHEHNLILVLNLSAYTEQTSYSSLGEFDHAALGEAADLVVLMAYNKSNLFTSPGPTAPCAWTEAAIKYATGRIRPDKIVLGVPAYGYDWMAQVGRYAGFQFIPVNLSFQAQSLIGQQPVSQSRDGDEFRYTDSGGNTHHVWLENEASLNCKIDQIDRYNLAGLSFWSLGQEPAYYWQTLRTRNFYP